MGSGHSHGPPAGHAGAKYRGKLAIAFGLIATFFVVELVYGLLADSLALISDAGHMAADVVALGAALAADGSGRMEVVVVDVRDDGVIVLEVPIPDEAV